MLYAAGRSFNHLSRAVAPLVVSPGLDAGTGFALSNLFAYQPNLPILFSAYALNPYVGGDLNVILGASFTENPIVGWVADTGTLTRDTVQKNIHTPQSPASGMLANNGPGQIHNDIVVRSGELASLEYAFRSDAGIKASIRIQNLVTGNWLRNDGTWDPNAGDLDSTTSVQWTWKELALQIEPLTTTLQDLCTLRIYGLLAAAGSVHFDDFAYYPSTDLCAIFGHNAPVSVSFQLLTDPGNVFQPGTPVATITPTFPSAFALLGGSGLPTSPTVPVAMRFFRLYYGGKGCLQSSYVQGLGELVLAQTTLTQRLIDHPDLAALNWLFTEVGQITNLSRDGNPYNYTPGPFSLRSGPLPFRFTKFAEYQQLRDGLFRGTRGSQYRGVILPTEADTDFCLFGYFAPKVQFDHKTNANTRLAVFTFNEMPFPVLPKAA